jgi:hypothetical protein
MRIRVFPFTVVVLAATLLPVPVSATSKTSVGASQSPPSVCRDKEGNLKDGDLDVLTIFDDSRSLSGSENGGGSDVDGKRFDAVEEFLTSFATTKSNRTKNFGLIKFGQTAKVIVPLGEITEENFKAKISDIRRKIPNKNSSQEKQTNYVLALKKAKEEFDQRPERNCKILIWFTDGVFDTKDSKKLIADVDDSDFLEREVCGTNGLANQIQDKDINTFVVFLKGRDDPAFKKRRSSSQDAMQVITGDVEPNFSDKSSPRDIRSGKCSLEDKRHLGEVLSANDASELIGFLVDLVLVADGGKSIVDRDCPIDISDASSVKLPSGYFIEWLSITTWNKSPKIDTNNLTVEVGESSVSFTDIFEIDKSSGTGGRSQRFTIKASEQARLVAGWSLNSADAKNTCLRVKLRDLKFKVKKSEPQFLPVTPKDLPEPLFKNRLTLRDSDGKNVSVEEALSLQEVTGWLQADSVELFVDKDAGADGKLKVQITIDGRFEVDPAGCSLTISVDNKKMAGKKINSSSCQVVPSSGFITSFDATAALEKLTSSCPVGGWNLLKDGVRVDSLGEFVDGEKRSSLTIQSAEEAPRKAVKCAVNDASIVFSGGANNGSVEIPVSASLNILKPESPLWPLLALLLVLLFTLLSLIALRFLNMLIVKAPRKEDFFSYVTNAQLVPGELDRAAIQWPTSSREFEIDANKLQVTKGDDSRNYLAAGSYRFELRLPRLLHPFEHARLQLVDSRPAVFWRSNAKRDGFPLSFTNGVGVVALSSKLPTTDAATEVDVVLLVPKRGADAGVDGVVKIIRSSLGDLAPELLKTMRMRVAEEESTAGSSVNEGGKLMSRARREKRNDASVSNDVGDRTATSTPSSTLGSPPSRPMSRPNSSPNVGTEAPQRPQSQPPEPPRR